LPAAVDRALKLVSEGADIIDVGGQSTRPGSEPVSEAEELGRTVTVVEAIVSRAKVPVSIDTDKAVVAKACRLAGAKMLNDVSALRFDPAMLREAVAFEAVILMHMGGDSPKTMQNAPRYENVVNDVRDFLERRIAAFVAAGGERRRVLVDPGIGFGKDLSHNLSLIKNLGELAVLAPVVLGASRKSFFARISPDNGPEDRLPGSLATACWAAQSGARVIRVHDVLETRRALETLSAIRDAK
jgi:dihydropteroate synthase